MFVWLWKSLGWLESKSTGREDWVKLIPAQYLPADLLSVWEAGDRTVPG